MNPRILLLVTVLAVTGCGASQGDLAGKVSYRGRPVGYGTVVAIGSDGLPYHGELRPDGGYTIIGIPAGVATVCVASPPPAVGNGSGNRVENRSYKVEGMRAERGDETEAPAAAEVVRNWQAIPERYSDPARSKLQFTIKPGSNGGDIPLD